MPDCGGTGRYQNQWVRCEVKRLYKLASNVCVQTKHERMEDELKIIVPVEGMGKGKYKFSV